MKNKNYVSLVVLIAVSVFVSGCIPHGGIRSKNTFNLRWTSPMPAAASKGDVAIQVVDQRSGNQGGTTSLLIGKDTSVVQSKLWAPAGQEPPTVIKKLVSEALASAGYRPVEPMAGVPTVTVALTSFWTTGFNKYTMTLNANLSLSGGLGGPWSAILMSQSNIQTTVVDFKNNFERGYKEMLDKAVTQLVQHFQSAAFQMAAGATAVPAPTAPAPTAPAATAPAAPLTSAVVECKLNSDCPIGKHCSANTCIYECREDRDCATNQVCNTQKGTCETAPAK